LKEDKCITIGEMFSGIGAFRKAFEDTSDYFKVVWANDIDKYACQVYRKQYGSDTMIEGDITKLDKATMKPVDLLVGGFPCFKAGTLVLTYNGYKPIEEIQVNDLVLTHKGNWKRVYNTSVRKADKTLTLKALGLHQLVTTEEHPFLTREKNRIWNNDEKRYIPSYGVQKWLNAGEFTKTLEKNKTCLLLSSVVPPTIKDNHSTDFWWIIGFYLASGWVVRRKNRKEGNGRVLFACSEEEVEIARRNIGKLYHSSVTKERTGYRLQVANSKLFRFVKQFGTNSLNKELKGVYLGLDSYKCKVLLDGFFFGSGLRTKTKTQSITTVSEKLAYSLMMCYQRAYAKTTSIFKCNRPPTHVIEGRTVNQHNFYVVKFADMNREGFVEEDYLWKPLRSVKETKDEMVYNISVEDDESYTANNIIVHNCQSFSYAGKKLGFNEQRGKLFFEMAKYIQEHKPLLVLLENVKGLLTHDKEKTFFTIIKTLNDLGYVVDFRVLNSKNFNVPHNRERIFILATNVNKLDAYPFLKEMIVKGFIIEKLIGYMRGISKKQLKLLNEFPYQYVINRLEESLKKDSVPQLEKKLCSLIEENVKEYDLVNWVKTISESIKKFKDELRDENGKYQEKDYRTVGLRINTCSMVQSSESGGHTSGYNREGSRREVFSFRTDDRKLDETQEDTQGKGTRVRCNNTQDKERVIANTISNRYYKDGSENLIQLNEDNGKQVNRVYSVKGISPTVPTACGGRHIPKIAQSLQTDGYLRTGTSFGTDKPQSKRNVRRLTPRECERLQSFPDDFTLEGLTSEGKIVKISDTQRYKMCGNSITVNVVKEISKNLVKFLNRE